MKKTLLLLCGCATIMSAGCNSSQPSSNSTSDGQRSAQSEGKPTVAVVPKGSTHTYWKAVQSGADKAGKELGANIVFKGPVQEGDRAAQIKIVEQFVTEGMDAIMLAPLDEAALAKPVREAKAKKIPVIIFDSALNGNVGTDFTAYIATNNYQGGVLAGKEVETLLKGKGKVVMLRYQEGSASTHEREEGFMSVIKKASGLTVISDNRYSGATAGEAKDSALNMVDKLKEADAIYTPNESSTLGMLLALRQAGLAGKKIFVGFDTSKPLLEGLTKSEINALIAQNPTKMGYDGVKTALAALKGEKIAETQDTGVAVVTPKNLNDPKIKAIIG